MLTLITGTPGAGKSLYAVWEIARKVPGTTVETDGEPVQRKLFSNIKNLLVEHTHIDAKDLDTWHTWAKPGDVIVFDEVQEVWRPRGLGTKVPDCIAALETHRHLGVDIILITQHPMLCDPNIRRLCNQHFHLRRLGKILAYLYEWDHCSDVKSTKTALQGRMWWHPKKAYKLYKSAQLHTKPTARMPRLALVGLVAIAGLAYMAPTAFGRITDRFAGKMPGQETKAPAPTATAQAPTGGAPKAQPVASEAKEVKNAEVLAPVKAEPYLAGCAGVIERCACFDQYGHPFKAELQACREHLPAKAIQLGGFAMDDRITVSDAERESADVRLVSDVRQWRRRASANIPHGSLRITGETVYKMDP